MRQKLRIITPVAVKQAAMLMVLASVAACSSDDGIIDEEHRIPCDQPNMQHIPPMDPCTESELRPSDHIKKLMEEQRARQSLVGQNRK